MKVLDVRVVLATEKNLQGYARMVSQCDGADVDTVTWPAPGWRPVLKGTGNEAGTVEGLFRMKWEGDFLYGKNEAVGSTWLTG